MTYRQRTGRVIVPAGKKVAVGVSIDFDAMAIWDGSFHMLTPAYMARGVRSGGRGATLAEAI